MGNLPPSEQIRSKGYTLKGALAFLEESYGEEGRAKAIAAIEDPELRRTLSGVILSAGWYPFRTQVELYRAADLALGEGNLELCWQIGRFTADYEFSTIHRVILKLGNIGHLLRLSGAMWGRYYSVGKMRVTETASDHAYVEISEFNPIHPAFCADLAGWMERTMELSGCREPRLAHTACLLDGHPACRYEGSWQG